MYVYDFVTNKWHHFNSGPMRNEKINKSFFKIAIFQFFREFAQAQLWYILIVQTQTVGNVRNH